MSRGATARMPAARRAVLVGAVPVAMYAIVRPAVGSDALALMIAGAVPAAYLIVLALWRRQLDPLALLVVIGFVVACAASLLWGGSSLPLKLHEAAVTLLIGLTLLVAALVRRPIPLNRLLRIPAGDGLLSTVIGSFLVLHAVLHLALAVSLSTAGYLVAGRIVDLSTIAVGAACLIAYRRRVGASAPAHATR